MADSRITKIKALAERGATEGERAAAREALKRLEAAGVTEDRPVPAGVTGLGNVSTDEAIRIILGEEDWFKFFSSGATQSTAASHHGRVWFDRSS